ncbi:MAG: hypothetical protein GHCLOJNM_04480 [bacterium]|nr:hypothetical protein [bacterium]
MRGLLALLALCYLNSTSANSPLVSSLNAPMLEPETTLNELNRFIAERIPPLELPKTAKAWDREAAGIRERVLSEVVFRNCPAEWRGWKARAEWGAVIESGRGYRIRKLRYEALPGLWIPAVAYEPDRLEGKVPVVLNVNGHVGPVGKAIDYEQIRMIHLARGGIVSLHPEWLSFGELQGKGYGHNRLAYLDLCGRAGLSVFYLAMRGGLDALLDHPHADPERVAMTGLSGGGWQTITLSSLDTRITLSAPNAGYIGLARRLDNQGDIGDLEQNPVNLMTVADYTHLTGLLAPRPTLLLYNDKDECCFQTERAKPSVYDPLIPFFDLYGKRDSFEFHANADPGTHNYDLDNRRALYAFLNKHFVPDRPLPLEESHAPGEILAPETLYMGVTESNHNFTSLAKGLMADLPANRPPTAGSLDRWRARGRKRLEKAILLERGEAKGALLKEERIGGLEARSFQLRVGGEWTLPVAALSKGTPKGTTLLLADKGKATLADLAGSLVDAGERVVALDPLFMGECLPGKTAVWQYAQMVACAGERPLGIQTGQVLAAAAWARREFSDHRVRIMANGPTTQVAALCAKALEPGWIAEVEAREGLASLKELIEKEIDYSEQPALFCFGLLAEFDIEELTELGRESSETRSGKSVRKAPGIPQALFDSIRSSLRACNQKKR